MKEYNRVQANINLDAIRHNLIETQKLINPGTKIMAIIKADGYGHGAVPIANAIDELVQEYGVAILDEGIELRNAGVTKPILILGFTPKEYYPKVIEYNLMPTVFQYEMAKQLSDEAVRQNKQAKIHIKLDTGMSRIGFRVCQESIDIIKDIVKLPGILLEGMFTHFACADMHNHSSADVQLKKYLSFTEQLEKEGIQIPTKHVSNSAAIIQMPEANLDMVRSGISTYGLYPSDEVDETLLVLKPAMELVTRIVYIKDLEAGIGIGYGSSYVTKRPTKVATIPIGYADGYPRALSNQGRVLIKGQTAPIIGRICMDQFMVDITDLIGIEEGDVVTLIGQNGNERITVEEIGAMANSFNYEVVCDISKRVPRVYYLNQTQIATMRFEGKITPHNKEDDNMK